MNKDYINLRARNLYAKDKLSNDEINFIETLHVGSLVETTDSYLFINFSIPVTQLKPIKKIHADWEYVLPGSTGSNLKPAVAYSRKTLKNGLTGVVLGGILPDCTINTRKLPVLVDGIPYAVDIKYLKKIEI